MKHSRHRRYFFSVFFLIYTDHGCLRQISKKGESKTRVQRWTEFLSAYNLRLSYRQRQDNANADFFSRLRLPPTEENISGSSALSDPDDLGVYVIRAYAYIAPSCPILGVGLGGLALLFYPTRGTGLDELSLLPATPVLGGLSLTNDDLRTHHSPRPTSHAIGPTTRPFAAPTEEPCLYYVIGAE